MHLHRSTRDDRGVGADVGNDVSHDKQKSGEDTSEHDTRFGIQIKIKQMICKKQMLFFSTDIFPFKCGTDSEVVILQLAYRLET